MSDEQHPFAAAEEQQPHMEESPLHEEDKDKKIKQLEEDLNEYKDKYLRTLAEMENARKRLQKEKHETTRFGIENVIADILMPLDNLENALRFAQNMSEETRQWAMGFQMIVSQFKDIFQNHGVVPFHSEGMPFDPHKHEAMEMEESDQHSEGTVMQEFVKGYKSGERTIRPARVKVAKSPGKDPADKDGKNPETK